MADPIQISMYIKSLGLSGKEAEAKRAELEKLSEVELTQLISGKSFEFGFIPQDTFFDFRSGNSDLGIRIQKNTHETIPLEGKKYSPYEKRQLRNYAAEYLQDSANNAYEEIKRFNSGVGLISTDAVVNGFKIFTGQEDRHALESRLSRELEQIKQLNSSLSQPGAWESKFERARGVLYNPQNIENLKLKSEEYLKITAYHDKHETLQKGIKDVKNILREENEYSQAMKNLSGPARVALTPPKVSSHEKFGQILLEFCDGDQALVNSYLKNISAQMGSKAEIEKNMLNILNELSANCKKEYDIQLKGKSYEQFTKEYENAYSKALGGKNPEFETKNYIHNAKTAAAYTEMGILIASSLLLPGSSTVAKGTSALAMSVGKNAAGQIVKGTIAATMAGAPAAMTAVGALTSEDGLTDEKKNEMLEKVKSGLLYGGFGAYVSGPLGNVVEKLIKTQPLALSGAVQKVMSNAKVTSALAQGSGVVAETSADVLFDGLTSDVGILESIKNNGGMNLGMMLVGGRVAKLHDNLKGIKIEQAENGSYKLKDANGKIIFNAKDDNTLASFVLGKAENLAETIKNDPTANTPKVSSAQIQPSTIKGNDLVKVDAEGKNILTSQGEQLVRDRASQMHEVASNKENEIVTAMVNAGLGVDNVNMTHRAKSEQSIYDKVSSAMTDPKYPASFEKSVAGVYDAVGTRTRIEDFNYKDYPDIVEMYKKDPEKAYFMAAERQSQKYLQALEELIVKQANGESDILAVKVSNYMGQDGIPYLTKEQVEHLNYVAAKHNIDLNIKDETPKVRPSGYTAYQMNFKTKDGFTFEWQMRGSRVNEFAECEHVPYDIRQKKDVTGGKKELEPLYKPIEDIVNNLSDDQFKRYNDYLTDHYKHLRKLELGFDSVAPKLEDYGEFGPIDKSLSADGLEKLHETAIKVKSKELSPVEAVKYYNNAVYDG